MAYSRLLLLLIGVISTNLPEVNTRPIDFWCNPNPKQKMMEMINVMAQANCSGLDVLPSPVQLPCTWINTEWKNKPAQEKHVDVLETLQVFQHGVRRVKNETSLQCHTSMLEGLEQNINRLVNIVNQAYLKGDAVTSSRPSGQICGSETNFMKVVNSYKLLIKGKLHHLSVDLCSSMTQDNKGTSS